MTVIFWASAALIAYVYLGYPLVLVLWARLRPAEPVPRAGQGQPASELPGVTIVIAARNEAQRLPARIRNLLALDYPASRRQIVVVSDGSTDDTEAVLEPYASYGVEVLTVPAGGKAAALNAGVSHARHSILVFADARQAFAPDALRELVAPFADSRIGGVTGELLLDVEAAAAPGRRRHAERRLENRPQGSRRVERRAGPARRGGVGSSVADGVGIYWRYEKQLRRLESRIGSTLGATGAIYALRRSLWRPLPPDTLIDDVLTPMRAVLAGYRVVFNERALAFDRIAPDARTEGRRKVRTLAGNIQILSLEPRLLVPIVNPVWLQYASHKLGRLIVPYALMTLLVSSIALAGGGWIYAAALAVQSAVYLLAAYGAYLELASRPAVPARAQAQGVLNA